MASTEGKPNLTRRSLNVSDLIIFHNQQLSDLQSKLDCESATVNKKSDIKDILPITYCAQEKDEEKESLPTSECDKNDDSNKEDTNEKEEITIIMPVLGNNCKVDDSENVADPAVKGGNTLKRTRRTLLAQELDVGVGENSTRVKKKRKNLNDRFCWRCHKESVEAHCSACPRSWHRKCIGMQQTVIKNWICGECAAILRAENAETRSTAMAELSIDQLCLLLKHVVERMREYPGSEPFWKAVELSEAPNYLEYVVKPMDLSLLELNVRAKLYGSTDAFMADAKWIQHNCIVFNTCGGVYADTSKLTNAAKQIIKLARQEVSEIEACPDCYAHGKNLVRPQPAWFIEPCRRPHPLVWAKLKGFPFWPAKAMARINTQGFVDVRFFGEHDRAWVSPRNLYLYSEDPPVPLPRKRKVDMEECVREVARHCQKLELVFGQFKFAPPKVQYNPHDPMQVKLMLPNYDPTQSSTYLSPQLSTPKKTALLKRKSNVKKPEDGIEEEISPSAKTKTLNGDDVSIEALTIDDKSVKMVEEIPESRTVKSTSEIDDTLCNAEKNVQCCKDELTQNEIVAKSNVKPQMDNKVECDVNDEESTVIKSNVIEFEQKQNSENADADELELSKNVGSIDSNTGSKEQDNFDIPESDTEHSGKVTTDKINAGQNLSETQEFHCKVVKSIEKTYKPKSKAIGKANIENAITQIVTSKSPQLNVWKSTKYNSKNGDNNNSTCKNNMTEMDISNNTKKARISANNDKNMNECNHSETITEKSTTPIINIKQSTGITVNEEGVGKVSSGQTESKSPPQPACSTKESKARKSFSNKARNCPQLIPCMSRSICNSKDNTIHMSLGPFENSVEYQMLPPEAGPVSARLYHSAQDLASKMAKLMEEAYKEAAQDNQHCENGTISENHQTTVHFLRLQIERMRWQHQQQLNELKHNTDRILREMKSSLEAERVRAVEETRREAEDEKVRCIEEIKRKQWCAMCGREALFYCCWNTAYCDYPCQQSHWPIHVKKCGQKPSFATIVTSSSANSNQQQVMPNLMINTQHAMPNIWRT